MKLAIIIFVFLVFFNNASFSQENQKDLQLFDEFSVFNCEELLSRLDNFSVTLYQNPNAIGYVVIYDNGSSIDNKFLERYLLKYRGLRKIDENRFVILTTNLQQNKRIDFWVSQNGITKPNIKEENFSFLLPKTEKPILFVGDWVEIVKIDGKLEYSSYCPACCINDLNLYFLAEFLNANSQFNAFIKIRGKSRFYTQKLEKLVRDELTKDYRIESKRFRISYQGIDEGIAQLPKNNATIEIEFIPQK